MLDITQLNCSLAVQAAVGPSKRRKQLGLVPAAGSPLRFATANPRPVVTWRVTRSCNLNCRHCLSDSGPRHYGSELTTSEGMALISDLEDYKVPRLTFAGGEPLLRADLPELVAYAREKGIQPSLFSNGILLSPARAKELKRVGLHSVSIRLEGIGREVDHRSGMPGAFDAVLEGYTNCEAAGLEAEVRIPLSRWNYSELASILDLVERHRIRRAVFVHLVYAGRGNSPQDNLTFEQKRRALDAILEREEAFRRRGAATRVATDENHVDGIYLYLQLARRNPQHAEAAYRRLEACGGAVRGVGVGTCRN